MAGFDYITDWAGELAPYLDQASRMLGVVRYPYLPTDEYAAHVSTALRLDVKRRIPCSAADLRSGSESAGRRGVAGDNHFRHPFVRVPRTAAVHPQLSG